MGRIVKDYDERYSEFLDVAQGLFYSKGYEATSVQEIIRAVGVAKGTFYHYFDSKADILEAIVVHASKESLKTLQPIASDKTLGAVDKLKQFFLSINNWKVANREFMIETARVMYADENVLLRSKMREQGQNLVAPILGEIIEQGVEKGIFSVDYPLATAELILTMSESLSASTVSILLASEPDSNEIEQTKQKIVVYNRCIERILGLPEYSLTLIDPEIIDAWIGKDTQ